MRVPAVLQLFAEQQFSAGAETERIHPGVGIAKVTTTVIIVIVMLSMRGGVAIISILMLLLRLGSAATTTPQCSDDGGENPPPIRLLLGLGPQCVPTRRAQFQLPNCMHGKQVTGRNVLKSIVLHGILVSHSFHQIPESFTLSCNCQCLCTNVLYLLMFPIPIPIPPFSAANVSHTPLCKKFTAPRTHKSSQIPKDV